MIENNSFSIGEFSKKTGISVRTLHYYDEIGLLRPVKHPTSGHRIYNCEDLFTLQKIVSLKFLGYSLEQISHYLHEPSFSIDFNEMLASHLLGLQKEKEQIDQSMKAIKRVMRLIEKEEKLESSVLFSLIQTFHTEGRQTDWMEQHNLTNIKEKLAEKSEEDIFSLDQSFVQLTKEVKQLYGNPIEDPRVQEMVKLYVEASFSFLGEELIQKLAEADVEETDIQELENIAPSPFTEEEQQWLNQAMEYHIKLVAMESNE
ncbi:MerR family transcriptional regulator [Sutcliffiella cohnii]